MIRIQEFMERKGIRNQTELAKTLGLTQGAVSSWNSGARAPTHEMCVQLLKMGMTFRELFGDDFPDITLADLKEISVGKRSGYDNGTPEHEFDKKVEDSVLRMFSNLFKQK